MAEWKCVCCFFPFFFFFFSFCHISLSHSKHIQIKPHMFLLYPRAPKHIQHKRTLHAKHQQNTKKKSSTQQIDIDESRIKMRYWWRLKCKCAIETTRMSAIQIYHRHVCNVANGSEMKTHLWYMTNNNNYKFVVKHRTATNGRTVRLLESVVLLLLQIVAVGIL